MTRHKSLSDHRADFRAIVDRMLRIVRQRAEDEKHVDWERIIDLLLHWRSGLG
jgi:hypothetical protein